MSGPIITGIKGAYLQPQRFGFSETGEYAILVWEGTRNEIRSNIPAILSMGGFYDYEESFSGAKDRLTARFAAIPGQTEAPVDTWEFFAGEVEKDILDSDFAAALPRADKDIIRHLIFEPDSSQTPDATVVAKFLTGQTALTAYKLLARGVRSARVLTPAVRHTQTVSNNWTVKASLSNVGRVISSATMVSSEGAPGPAIFNIPTQAVPTQADGLAMSYGWRKKYPTIRVAARQKTQIEQEWEFGLWSDDIYGTLL